MLIFNEGLPRAGKSYDAVANHIIPALKSGRHVFARINGLNPYAIAVVAGMPEDRVRELLHDVSASEVPDLFRITVLDDGEKTKVLNPALRKDSLFVVDEVHEFWVAGRADLAPEVEWFFAYHGQFGMDGVLISQWYKRVHDAVWGRVERKHLFRKMNFMTKFRRKKGKDGDPAKRYICRQQIAMEPDKFAVLSSEEHDFKPEFFPCYRSFQAGAANVEAYDPGFSGVFSPLQKKVYIGLVVMLLCLGGYGYAKYSGVQKRAEQHKAATADAQRVKSAARAPVAVGESYQPDDDAHPPGQVSTATYLPPTGAALSRGTKVDTNDGQTVMTRYFFGLAKTARPRLAALVEPQGAAPYGIIEWRVGNFQVLERMDSRDLAQLGFTVELHDSYALLVANGETMLATAYPLDSPYSAPSSGTQASSVSEAPAGAGRGPAATAVGVGTAGWDGQQAHYGAMRDTGPSTATASSG